jgi:hypothetical protein
LIEAQGSAAAASADAPRSDAASGRRLATPATAAEATPCLEIIRAKRRAAAAILIGRNRGGKERQLVLRREEFGGGERREADEEVPRRVLGQRYLCERTVMPSASEVFVAVSWRVFVSMP